MATVLQSAHDRLVREAADRYIRKGFLVQVEPLEEDLPEFLRGYRPDLIVTTPEDKIVVEVKSKGYSQPGEYWEGLQKAIEAHSGWRFHLVLDNRREEELLSTEMPVLSRDEMEERLLASQQFVERGLLDIALVIAWSTLEAALREASRREGLQLPNQGPGPLITALYTEGDLEREDYDTLMQILQARNQAAHGFRVQNIERSTIEQAQQIARRLMNQYRQAA